MINKKFIEKLKKFNTSHKIKIRIRPDTGKFYLDYFNNYKHEIFQFDFSYSDNNTKDDYNLRLADQVRNKKEIEMIENNTGFTLTNKETTRTDLHEYAKNKLTYKKSTNLYWTAIKRLEDFNKKFVIIESITEKMLNDFIVLLERDSLSPATIKNYMVHIKALLNLAIEDGIIKHNPAKKTMPKGFETIKVYLTIPEVKTLIDHECKHQQIKNAFLFGCFTGLRISDIINLKWESVKDDHLLILQQKTKQIVSSSLSETAKRIIQEQKEFKTNLFVFNIPEQSRASKQLKSWTRSSGINKNISFHTARHTFATMCLTSGIDIYTVSKLLGHRDLKTTQVYAKLIDKVKTEAVNKLPKM